VALGQRPDALVGIDLGSASHRGPPMPAYPQLLGGPFIMHTAHYMHGCAPPEGWAKN
jgi:hypothetical protein